MYSSGSNYGSGQLMNAMNPLQITSGSTGSFFQKLSFLNPSEQTKFEQLFKQNVPDPTQQLTGEAARDIFLRSKLEPEILAQIWSLADINVTGTLSFPEFALAMYLINMKLTGQSVPTQLPNNLRQEILSAMQTSSSSTLGTPGINYSGYSPSGPTILGVTTPLGGSMPGMNMVSPQYNGQNQQKTANISRSQWAVTVEEKAKFDEIFKSLDNGHSGFLSGEKARQVFTESGLNKSDLAKIWGLADIHNQGKLNSDEFAVAMHLIYARLAGQEIPKSLPVNLMPPSAKDLSDSVSNLKQMLKTNSSLKRNTTLSSPIPGIPKLDSDLDSADLYSGKKASSKENDTGYVSSNRRKLGASPKPSSPKISYSERLAKLDKLRKQIKEKKLQLEDISAETKDSSFTTSASSEADLTELKRKIKDLQNSINEISSEASDFSKGSLGNSLEGLQRERRQLESEFDELSSELPDLMKKANSLDDKLAELKLELFKLTDAKIHKTAPSKTNLANLFPFKAAGSGENLTEADKLKQKAAEMLAQRMQALTKSSSSNDSSAIEAKKRLDTETDKINQEKKEKERLVKEIENSVQQTQKAIRDIVQGNNQSTRYSSTMPTQEDYEKEKKKWDTRFGLETETKQFLDELKKQEVKPHSSIRSSPALNSKPSYSSFTGTHSVASIPSRVSPTLSKPSLLASAQSKEEKDRIIREEAERRLKERQAFFLAQIQKTKEQKSSVEHKVEKMQDAIQSGGDNSYARNKLASVERERKEIENKFLQKSKEFSAISEKTQEERKQIDSFQTQDNRPSNDVLPPPPPPPPSVGNSQNTTLGGYKTLWLNKPSTRSEEPAPKSSVPSFIPKSKNPFPVSHTEKTKSPVIPEPSKESSSEDEDDAEQEKAFRERIEKAKREEKERSEAHQREQEAIREATRTAREKAKNMELNSQAKSKTPAFISHSNNVFTGSSFSGRSTEPSKPSLEPSHSPKDDEWDVVEKLPSPSNQAASSTNNFDELFAVPAEATPSAYNSTAFDDAFNISPEPNANQQSVEQPTKFNEAAEEAQVLFRARALYDYQSENPDDLSFHENDFIQVSQVNDDSDWWYGELESNGARGWFPKSYVEQGDSTPAQQPFLARVLYDYVAQQEDELSVNSDAVIDVLEKIDENWWRAQIEGRIGLVPATYCEELTQ